MNGILNYIYRKEIITFVLSLAVAVFGYYLLKTFLLNYIKKLVRTGISEVQAQQRVKTFERLILSILKLFFIFFFLFTVLDLFGLDVKALVLSAGVAGLAVSFGAQSLVKDLISGLFMLLEDQFSLGDYVRIVSAGNIAFEGVVFTFGSRFVILLQSSGKTVYIPFGNVVAIENFKYAQSKLLPDNLKHIVDLSEKLIDKRGLLMRYAYLPEENTLILYLYGTVREKKIQEKLVEILKSSFEDVNVFYSGSSTGIIAKSEAASEKQ